METTTTKDHADMGVVKTNSASPPAAEYKENDYDNTLRQKSTYIEDGGLEHLSQDHRDYLLQRHGTLDLDPLPSDDPADPYNWPNWKKEANLVLVAFHAMMCTFTAAGPIPAFETIGEDLGVSITEASYLVGMFIAVLGFAPLFWKPLSYRFGRRPIWFISTIGAGLFNVGCALSKTYGAMAACRCLCAFFISPAIAIGSGVVVETFFKRERARHVGIWTLMVTLGPPVGPFIMGFVAYHIGYRWIYWINAIINLVQFVAYIFLGPETRYIRRGVEHRGSAFKKEYLNFTRLDPSPLRFYEFIKPCELFAYSSVFIPTFAYTVVFGFTSVFLTVEIPQIFVPKWHMNPQALGLQFLGMIIGSIIGEQLGGPLSDYWMTRKTRALKAQTNDQAVRPQPEYRLWLSYAGFVLCIVGLIVFGVQTTNLSPTGYNVTPIIGIAIAAVGNQLITTVLVTYAVDSHPEHSSSIGVFVNLVRSTWGFIVPFWSPYMISSVGMAKSGGIMAALVFACSWLPTIVVQFLGGKWRTTRVEKDATGTKRGD